MTTYRLTNDSQHGFHDVAVYGPLVLPLAVKESDIVTHGANNFVKVRERTAADGEMAGEFVLQGGDVEVVSQHDWHKLGVKLVDGSSDPDGFLDKADTESEDPQQKEASKFFSTLYDKLVTDRDNDGTLSGNDIKAALADEELAGKLRMLFIKHKSEWVKPGEWPRLKQELAEQPKLYEYAMQVHNNMAWMEDASAILGDTQPWFIHPAGMMGLVGDIKGRELITLEMVFAANLNQAKSSCEAILPYLNEYAKTYGMQEERAIAHFLSQVGHESNFQPVSENLRYNPKGMRKIFGCKGGSKNYDPILDDAKEGRLRPKLWTHESDYAFNPEALGNYVYANRPGSGNGDENSGDGYKYRGRGLIQITHKDAYIKFTKAHNAANPSDQKDFLASPDDILTNRYAASSAYFFWFIYKKGFNLHSTACTGTVKEVTKIVNGGDAGYADRLKRFNAVAAVIGIDGARE